MIAPFDDPTGLPKIYAAGAPAGPDSPALQGHHEADIVIIGAGFTGVSAAVHLAEAGRRVVVIEAREIGWGASGRNFGQVVPYAKHIEAELLEHLGPVYGPRFLDAAAHGPDVVFGLIERHGIGCAAHRRGLIFAAHAPEGQRSLERRAAFWSARQAPVEMLDPARTAGLIGSDLYRAALLDQRGGTLNPLAYVRGLALAAARHGAVFHTGTRVTGLAPAAGRWNVTAPDGTITAQHVIIATDAYTGPFSPQIQRSLIPMRGYQLVSRPLSENVRATILPQGHALTDTRRLFSGVRLHPDGRLQVGLDGPAFRDGPPHIGKATQRVRTLFPQIGAIEWDETWSGWVGMTADQYPQLVMLAPGCFGALGYSGRGIALATTLGRELARHVTGMPATELALPLSSPRPIAIRPIAGPLVGGLLTLYRALDHVADRRLQA